MLVRFPVAAFVIAALVAPIIESTGHRAAACDRFVLRAASTHVVAVAPLQLVAPTSIAASRNASCHKQAATTLVVPHTTPVAVAPLTLVPLYSTAVFVPVKVHAARVHGSRVAVRAAAVRPLVVRPLAARPNRSRTVTRVRTVVR